MFRVCGGLGFRVEGWGLRFWVWGFGLWITYLWLAGNERMEKKLETAI